jgi:hypothetical protein
MKIIWNNSNETMVGQTDFVIYHIKNFEVIFLIKGTPNWAQPISNRQFLRFNSDDEAKEWCQSHYNGLKTEIWNFVNNMPAELRTNGTHEEYDIYEGDWVRVPNI